MTVDYQSKGFAAGIQELVNGVVDFAGSDAAMTDEEIAKVNQGVVLLPMTAGEIVLAYDLDGIEELRLPRYVYPQIFLCNVTNWSDEAIAAANPDVDLPDPPITVVVGSDSSGTTYNFTSHLAEISEDFAGCPGAPSRCSGPTATRSCAHRRTAASPRPSSRRPARSATSSTATPSSRARQWRCSRTRPANSSRPVARLVPRRSGTPSSTPTCAPSSPTRRVRAPIRSRPSRGCCFSRAVRTRKVEAINAMIEYGLTDGHAMAEDLGYIPLPESVIDQVRDAGSQIGAAS